MIGSLLQRISPLLALGVFRCGAQNFDAIGGTSDIDGPPATIACEAYDPLVDMSFTDLAMRLRWSRYAQRWEIEP
jgi:hypothetical protein